MECPTADQGTIPLRPPTWKEPGWSLTFGQECPEASMPFQPSLGKSEVRSLGICLDPDLTMETQVASVVRAAHFHLWRIAQLHSYLDAGGTHDIDSHPCTLKNRLLQCSLCGATLEADAETSTEFGSQINNWGEEIPAHLPHSGCPSLATGSHRLQGYDYNI